MYKDYWATRTGDPYLAVQFEIEFAEQLAEQFAKVRDSQFPEGSYRLRKTKGPVKLDTKRYKKGNK